MKSIRRIWADQRGNTAMLFGLAVVPILALAGGAVDFSHRANVHTRAQSAADTAALAAARMLQGGSSSDEEDWAARMTKARRAADDVFRATLGNDAESGGAVPAFSVEDGVVKVSAEIDVPTAFLGVMGIESLDANALSEVRIPDQRDVEIAFVLDYSRSMLDSDKYIRMTAAATEFIQKVAERRADRSAIAVVPFSEFVYATLPSSNIRGTPDVDANVPRTTCLKNRNYPYSASDDDPRSAVPESRWPEQDAASAECQLYATNGLNVIDLTTDFGAVETALAGMRPTGKTNIALAAELGWHVLSPGEPFDTARHYAPSKVHKVLILLTDGMQTVDAEGPDGTVSTTAADETTAELCDNISDAGISLFTVAYDISDEHVRNLLSGCASDPEKFHEAQGPGDVAGAFEDIYLQITASVWLSR